MTDGLKKLEVYQAYIRVGQSKWNLYDCEDVQRLIGAALAETPAKEPKP